MSFKLELLFSIYMSIYSNIIGIRKYVIKKVIYNIGNTIPWVFLSAMTVITKTKAPEARD